MNRAVFTGESNLLHELNEIKLTWYFNMLHTFPQFHAMSTVSTFWLLAVGNLEI